MNNYTIALAGNPNCGKTTVFNALTGSKQHVGNWPGVTVERLEGKYSFQDHQFTVIDLPGIYSFSARTLDEKVSREFILLEKPDLVVNVVDAANLERNLYLTTQLMEMKVPMIVALNMMDIAQQRRIKIEIEHLATHLDCKIIPIIAAKKDGIEDLKNAIYEASQKHHIPQTDVHYDSVVEEGIENTLPKTAKYADLHNVDNRWLTIKLLEKDELAEKITENKLHQKIADDVEKIEKHTNHEIDLIIADGRYGFIHGLAKDVVHRKSEVSKTRSDKIDKFVLNRYLSVPIFFFVMYLVFMLTINVGAPFVDFFDQFVGAIFVDGLGNLLLSWHFPAWLITILATGIGGGIQAVSTFIPPIFFMFFSLSILEDSGYMSRAAFVMDRFMRFIGLPGKAFIPMIVGFGCNVPAIMATRTLDNGKDRILTILINPLMSCGARLPVYAFFATVFFPRNGGFIIFIIYLTGIILAILSGLLFKKTLFKGETSTFVMELPSYHIPTFNGIMMHTWHRLKGFLLRAGKVIIFVVLLLTFLNSIGTDGSFGNEDSSNSILSFAGKQITPVFRPMGISNDNWPATVGLITGIFAKETVVGSINTLYSQMDENVETDNEFDLKSGIMVAIKAIPDGFKELGRTIFDPLGIGAETETETSLDFEAGTYTEMRQRFSSKNAAFAYLLFVLIYMPCVAVVAIIQKEIGTKWAVFSVAYLTGLAWIISTIFYQASTIAMNPVSSIIWIVSCIIAVVSFIGIMKYRNRDEM
ncbi:MAG: Fe(2+) transporter permease subunit FeoB [Candidatus Cloacimonetes bacterium]|nr:Fe(2+) transporter permease subunit FeoB [Candidatus Cloacimonadota bacterium]MCF7813347.1 Fe(2+) transporter permease subunit FeoB [Candidatus Cloacimonadota bacterium]MCF7867836.1 Fe(2+) transporter permease subunit FeoB [Candidatus Cloacimonadota bacterium]MCF7883278.1 Fe(2+) transporter permease subunit FeoB [Candidatus Cloacimonadota bacterium]